MTFQNLLTNIQAFADQSAGRVRTLRSGCGVMGSAAEQWDEPTKTHRLPTPDEFLAKVWRGIGPPEPSYRTHAFGVRRLFHPHEARTLVRVSRRLMRVVRREHPSPT